MNHPAYVSIVVVARNDNYGGDFLERITLFSEMLRSQAERYPNLFEIIVVNWNPLPNRSSIAAAVDWSMPARVRVVTVPAETHNSLCPNSNMPVLEYIGKNVGITRATGEFIIITNPDIIFSFELMELISKRKLRKDVFYRTDRYDFNHIGAVDMNPSEKYKAIQKNVFRVYYRNGIDTTKYENQDQRVMTSPFEKETSIEDGKQLLNDWSSEEAVKKPGWPVHNYASGDFILASREILDYAHGFWERVDTFTHIDTLLTFRMRALNIPQIILRSPYCIFHLDHPREEQTLKPKIGSEEINSLYKSVLQNESQEYANQVNWGLTNLVLKEDVFLPSNNLLYSG